MVTREKQDAAINALRMIPTKWAIAIVIALIAYVLLQPRLNQWFGWNLPSLASMVGDQKHPSKKKPAEKESDSATERRSSKTAADHRVPSAENSNEDTEDVNSQTRSAEQNTSLVQSHGFLKELGRGRFESPAGLIYGRGSEEGHRLLHIARHLEDQPDRPGSHGVFEGSMREFLEAIDDGYLRARRKAKGTKSRGEDSETVYEAPFEKTIGYLGGEDGKRKRNPPLKRLRIVVREKTLITAFPIP